MILLKQRQIGALPNRIVNDVPLGKACRKGSLPDLIPRLPRTL